MVHKNDKYRSSKVLQNYAKLLTWTQSAENPGMQKKSYFILYIWSNK